MKWKYLGILDIFFDVVLIVSIQLNETVFIKLGKGAKKKPDIFKVTFVAWTIC